MTLAKGRRRGATHAWTAAPDGALVASGAGATFAFNFTAPGRRYAVALAESPSGRTAEDDVHCKYAATEIRADGPERSAYAFGVVAKLPWRRAAPAPSTGPELLTAHTAFTYEVDRAMQLVDPGVLTPYWDFTLDAEFLGANWTESQLFQLDWFGPLMPKNAQRTLGRFANVSVPSDCDFDVHNAYCRVTDERNEDPSALKYFDVQTKADGSLLLPIKGLNNDDNKEFLHFLAFFSCSPGKFGAMSTAASRLLPASSFRLDALVAALGDAAWAEPLVHLSSERGAQAALGSYADVAAAVAAGDASAVLRLGSSRRPARSGPRRGLARAAAEPFEDAEAKLDRCASYDDVEMAGRACETLTLGPGDAAIPPRTALGARWAASPCTHAPARRRAAGLRRRRRGGGLRRCPAPPAPDALVAMADAGVFPPDAARGRGRRGAQRRLAEFAIGDDDRRRLAPRRAGQGWAGSTRSRRPRRSPPARATRRGRRRVLATARARRRLRGLRAVFGAFAAFDDEAACAAAAAFAAPTARAPSPLPLTATGPAAVERGALADVAVDGASRGAAADDFSPPWRRRRPRRAPLISCARVRQGRDACASATLAVDDGSVEVGLAAPRGALPQVLDCVAESGVVDASRDGATGLAATPPPGAVTGAATVTSAAGGDVALARRRALQTTTWRVGNACAVGTYGSGHECAELQRGGDAALVRRVLRVLLRRGCTSCASCPECEPGTYQPYTAQTRR
ncbi:hypothetical protein JL720_1 [Aureococcus anophagefferens]|nr:hypothetical protein JL720_1 [Aureococcus anophagefferens]